MNKQLTEELLKNSENIHFIGIGGSGTYPLVQIFHEEGHRLKGSDNNETKTTLLEKEMGIEVIIGQDKKNIEGADLIIYSGAISEDNEELIAAKKSKIPTFERSEVLGLLSRRYKNTIGISGTHGKTTTTSMLTQILFGAGADPSAVLGGSLASIGGYGRSGKSENFVVEACEFKDTFLKISPDIAVVLNVDDDHMDYFKNMENLKKSFKIFLESAARYVVANGDDEETLDTIKDLKKEIILFGLGDNNDYQGRNIVINTEGERVTTSFDVYKNSEFLTDIILKVPGEHNILNALAAIVCADITGIEPEDIKNGLMNFHGAGRRFEILGHYNNITVADDYAHHPTEIKATLKATGEMGFNTVWAIFQPFTYSRTALLLDEFSEVLALADRVLLTPIMGGREKNTYNIYSEDLEKKLNNAMTFKDFEQVRDYAVKNALPGDLILTMGCGDVDKVANMIKKEYEKNQ